MRKSRKLIAILATLALLATLLVPMVGPAAAATKNYVDRVPVFNDDTETANLGTLYIKEDEVDTFTGDQITITLLDGAEFIGMDSNEKVKSYVKTSTGLTVTGVTYSDKSITFQVTGGSSSESDTKDYIYIPFENINIKDCSGDIRVKVDAFDSAISSGEYVIGRVESSKVSVSILDVKTVSQGETFTVGTIRFTENGIKSFKEGGKIEIKLPSDFNWASKTYSESINGAFVKSIETKDETLTINFKDTISTSVRGFVDITAQINVPSDADLGDVVAEISGDNIDDVDLVIAKVKDYTVEIKADDPTTILTGKWDQEAAKVTLDQAIKGSILPKRTIAFELSGGARFIDKSKMTGGLTLKTDFTDDPIKDKVEYKTEDEETSTDYEFTPHVVVNVGTTGDVVLKVSGNAGVKGEVVVAKAVAPVEATASEPKEVRVGIQAQQVADVILTEPKKGAWDASYEYEPGKSTEGKIILETVGGVSFASRPTAEIVEGNIKLKDDNLVKLADKDGDGLYDQAYVVVDSESTRASKIKFSNIKLNIDRGVYEGDVVLNVKGDALVDPRVSSEFNASTAAKVVVANVVTPAPGEQKATVVFKVSDTKFTVNGVEHTMDVAPYVKNGRTYVPVRYSAQAVGVAAENILYSGGKVTLIKGDKVVQFTVGSNIMLINGVAVTMDVKAEVTNGRTMLPFRWVAQALGAQVNWDPAAQTVTMTL